MITYHPGRLGNQLLRVAHLLAMIIEFSPTTGLIPISFWPYSCLFEQKAPILQSGSLQLARALCGVLTWHAPAAFKTQARLGQFLKQVGLNLPEGMFIDLETDWAAPYEKLSADHRLLAAVKSHKVSCLYGHAFECWELFEKHQDKIRQIIAPRKRLYEKAVNDITRLRTSAAEFIIGIHVRRTDYRQWRAGEFFFELDQYRKWMQQLNDRFDGRSILFLVFSDERLNSAEFESIPHLLMQSDPNVESIGLDMFRLSCCDLIAGPPSTFTAWASFITRVPLLPLTAKGQEIPSENGWIRSIFDAHKHLEFGKSVQ